MRTVCWSLFAVTLSVGSLAQAQAVDPYGQAMPPVVVAPAPYPTVVAPAPTLDYPMAVPPPPVVRPRVRVQIAGQAQVGPVLIDGQVQFGGPPPPPPLFIYPPSAYPVYRRYPVTPVYVPSPRLICNACLRRPPPPKWDGVRRFSLGFHAMAMGINQKVGNNDVILAGGGLQMRLRSAGRFGFEIAQSFLHANIWNGGFVRDSYPFTTSLLFYLRQNRDNVHFNLYGLAGVGVMPDTVSVRFSAQDTRSQDFLEWEAHVGAGAELRFKWFGLDLEGRYAGLWRDNSDTPAAYYQGIPGGPVPNSSQAWVATGYLTVWF